MLGAGGTPPRPGIVKASTPSSPPTPTSNRKWCGEDRENGESQPVSASLTFGGRTFDFTTTHNAAAQAASLGIKVGPWPRSGKGRTGTGADLVDDGSHRPWSRNRHAAPSLASF